MGMDVNGPSAMGMYQSAGPQGTPPDTGQAMANAHQGYELSQRSRYATPSRAGKQELHTAAEANNVRDYNLDEGLPVKYSVPSAQKERLKARQSVREGIQASGGQEVQRTDPITEEEVSYLQQMQNQADLADFDRFISTLIDPRKPGNLKWLMEVYPEYVDRRIEQTHTDFEFALRNRMIDAWGINSFDDLRFKYLVDQEKIKGPTLKEDAPPVDQEYAHSWLSPYQFMRTRAEPGVRLPFASAKVGKRPAGDDAKRWALKDDDQPLGKGRTPKGLATSMYERVDPPP